MKTILDVKRRLAAARCPYPVSLMDDLEEAFAEIERLKAEKVELWDCPGCGFTYDACHEDIDPDIGEGNGNHTCPVCENTDLERENERLPKEIEEARKVIGWYGDKGNYIQVLGLGGDPTGGYFCSPMVLTDHGERARTFLAGQEGEGNQ
ncbi:hypothetical protein ABGV40_15100 [Paenibacillus amylolyticus]|uniref:hypothetical protein n=1 Tax=Paenibacillus amylolyticus TaxID=1451 RepID=UPI0032421565